MRGIYHDKEFNKIILYNNYLTLELKSSYFFAIKVTIFIIL